MLRAIDDLVRLLRDEVSRCDDMLQAAEREHRALRRCRAVEIQSAAAEKEAILQELKGLERRRTALIVRLAAELQVPETALTVEFLAGRLTESQAQRLKGCRAELRDRLGRLQQIHGRSEALCRGAIDMLHEAHQLLMKFCAGPAVYQGDGGYPAAQVSGRLVRGAV